MTLSAHTIGWPEASGGGGGDDELVKVSAADTTANYLDSKVNDGLNIVTSILNPAGNEQLTIATVASPTFSNVYVSDGGVVGNSGGPQFEFDDTLDEVVLTSASLEILGTTDAQLFLTASGNDSYSFNAFSNDDFRFRNETDDDTLERYRPAVGENIYYSQGNSVLTLYYDQSALFEGDVTIEGDIIGEQALILEDSEDVGEGYVGLTEAANNPIDPDGRRCVIMTPTATSTDNYFLSDGVEGQEIVLLNLGTVSLDIGNVTDNEALTNYYDMPAEHRAYIRWISSTSDWQVIAAK